MRPILFSISTCILFIIAASGQRVINRFYFIFPKSTIVDTIGKRSPFKFALTLDAPLYISKLPQEKEGRLPKTAKRFFKPTLSDIHFADSLIKTDMLQAIVSGDSLLYVRNRLYIWYNQQSADFYKYRATKQEVYKKAVSVNRKKVKHSDRYYFGYVNDQDQKRLVILFDPKKIKYRSLGDMRDFDYCEPMVVDVEAKKISFGYFPFPDPE